MPGRQSRWPRIPWQHPAEFLPENDRWQLLRRCLTDDAIPLDIRAASAPTLFFGLRGEHIRNPTADQIVDNDQGTYHTSGEHHVTPTHPSMTEVPGRSLRGTWG
ncbi:hypothetical protein OG563_06515 [Nocardia vinacea]|uniref:Uncharacterized protein n=1 Tax=Nocardia vinacea TaxID=96468 RepID=A0ABZ1Z078_9NOCA|nr:hypothetical protein [Nocardia vinacea]